MATRSDIAREEGARHRYLLLLVFAMGVIAIESVVEVLVRPELSGAVQLMAHVYERTLVLVACCLLGMLLALGRRREESPKLNDAADPRG